VLGEVVPGRAGDGGVHHEIDVPSAEQVAEPVGGGSGEAGVPAGVVGVWRVDEQWGPRGVSDGRRVAVAVGELDRRARTPEG
jgi:hypothetical protein